eukprot:TRINITY_DN5032_c2_g3_i1.p1 TRINITY_DN5032_c2_g3~~TRINITY_DN5032_c2_g3_i1.p1  ORF type:complete len:218 (-),score=46.26 TRINITY_DN5032_c2_g3_i1:250-903(-)
MASILGFSLPASWLVTALNKQTPTPKNHIHFSASTNKTITISSSSSSSSSSSILHRRFWLAAISESSEAEVPNSNSESDSEATQFVETQLAPPKKIQIPKGEEVFAVVMVGSRQYIVFPGRFLYTQRLKGANVNDKIILNKVLLVGTKSETYIGKPVVPNAAVHAVVEEQGLNRKVVVFKYKKKKNYRRNIGHRQPNTRILITGITGYQDSPAAVAA